jgi:hypothetical protein
LALPPESHLPGEDGRLAKKTGGDLGLQLATASLSDNAMVNVVDLPGSTVPAGFLLPPLALSKILDLAPTVRGVHQRLNR